jgi:erythromycin esterase-like protein
MTNAEFVRELAQPLSGSANDYDALLELIGNARVVLLGEASHGTHEFYFEGVQITKRLIAEENFTVLALDETRAVQPLERTSVRGEGELPETYPFKV